MKIIYFGTTESTDSDFPLIREYQRRGEKVYYYICLNNTNLRNGLFNIKKQIQKFCICKASDYKELHIFKDYINIDEIYIINLPDFRLRNPLTIYTWIKVLIKMFKHHADVFHTAWPLVKMWKILYLLPQKKILTVHDPFMHSGSQDFNWLEKARIYAFKKTNKLILLNSCQYKEFVDSYKINPQKVCINHLGEFDYLRQLRAYNPYKGEKYIIFFGNIREYKGLEFLCEAMLYVHKKCPHLKLIIAGSGKIYFDFAPYENDYIILLNRYIGVAELAELLRDSLFTVCPYKDATQSGVVQTAFSLSVPAIVTNVGALPEVIKDGLNGRVVESLNVNELSLAIIDLFENSKKLNEMKKYISLNWQKQMSWVPIANKYIECYKRLLEE